MKAFYNDVNNFACCWLSNLMDAGEITPGVIDDRDIREISAGDLEGYDRVHLFAGIGGWERALRIAGNAIVPQVAAIFLSTCFEFFENNLQR